MCVCVLYFEAPDSAVDHCPHHERHNYFRASATVILRGMRQLLLNGQAAATMAVGSAKSLAVEVSVMGADGEVLYSAPKAMLRSKNKNEKSRTDERRLPSG